MVYEITKDGGVSEKRYFVGACIIAAMLFSVVIVFGVYLVRHRPVITKTSYSEVPRTWKDSIPSDLPADKIILLSDYINQSDKFDLNIGYGPLGVKEVDFQEIAPKYFTEVDVNSVEQNCFVAFFILRRVYSYYQDWPSTFVYYVYGGYALNSERDVDVNNRNDLLTYLGY